MADITATDAARTFGTLLDAIEQRGEHFTIMRRGKAIAQMQPVGRGTGAGVTAMLDRHRVDAGWTEDLGHLRDLLELDERT